MESIGCLVPTLKSSVICCRIPFLTCGDRFHQSLQSVLVACLANVFRPSRKATDVGFWDEGTTSGNLIKQQTFDVITMCDAKGGMGNQPIALSLAASLGRSPRTRS